MGFSFSFPWRELNSKECILLTPPYRCLCLGTAALTPIYKHFRNEHPFPAFIFSLWGNRETHLLNTVKTEANMHCVSHQGSLSISSLLQHKCNKIMGSQVEQKKHGLVQLQWRKHFYCVAICTKSCVTNPIKTKTIRTTEGARHSYLAWRKLLYWWGSIQELGASSTILVTPFQAKQTLAC